MLGHDLEMTCAKFQRNRFKIDGEIKQKHALQIILSYTICTNIPDQLPDYGNTQKGHRPV